MFFFLDLSLSVPGHQWGRGHVDDPWGFLRINYIHRTFSASVFSSATFTPNVGARVSVCVCVGWSVPRAVHLYRGLLGSFRPHLCLRRNIPHTHAHVSTLTAPTHVGRHLLGPQNTTLEHVLNIRSAISFFLSFFRLTGNVLRQDSGLDAAVESRCGEVVWAREQLWFCTKYFCCVKLCMWSP